MLRALQAIFFGLLFFWASKRKVTRAAAADRNARCVGGTLAGSLHKGDQRNRDSRNAKSLDDQPSAVEKRLLPSQE